MNLRVQVWSDWTFVKEAADEFESRHPNSSVEIVGITGPEYFDQLTELLKSSDSPDVTALQVIPGVYTDLVNDGLLVDMSPVWDELDLKSNYRHSTSLRYTTPNGKQFAVSTSMNWMPVVYYNADLMQGIGASMPRSRAATLEEWEAIVSKAKASDVVPMATYGISDEYGAAFILGTMLRSSCGDNHYSSYLTSWQGDTPETVKWTDECAVRAIRSLAEWGDSGIFGDNPAAQSSENALRMFESGQSLLYESGGWMTKHFADGHLGFNYDWFLLPPLEGGEKSVMMLADHDGLGVSAASKHQPEAMELLSIISSKEFQSRPSYLKSAGIPPRSDVAVKDSEDQMRLEQLDAVSSLGDAPQLTVSVPYHSEIAQLTRRLLAHELSPDELAAELDQRVAESRRGR